MNTTASYKRNLDPEQLARYNLASQKVRQFLALIKKYHIHSKSLTDLFGRSMQSVLQARTTKFGKKIVGQTSQMCDVNNGTTSIQQ